MLQGVAIDRAKKPDEIDVEELLGELEHKIERLKILYEQYFMGIEKIEPQTARKEITRKLLDLSQMNLRNTAWRYRFHAMNQKFGVYTTYWNRTLREIENGTYFRSVARVGRDAARRGLDVPDEILRGLPRLQRERILRERERLARGREDAPSSPQPAPRAAASTPPQAAEPGFDETFDALFDSLTGMSSRPSVVTPMPKPPRPLPAGMDEDRVKELHRQYVQAQLATGQTSQVKYEQILATVVKQGTKILEQHHAQSVDFTVVLRDGKVILKATPKR